MAQNDPDNQKCQTQKAIHKKLCALILSLLFATVDLSDLTIPHLCFFLPFGSFLENLQNQTPSPGLDNGSCTPVHVTLGAVVLKSKLAFTILFSLHPCDIKLLFLTDKILIYSCRTEVLWPKKTALHLISFATHFLLIVYIICLIYINGSVAWSEQ